MIYDVGTLDWAPCGTWPRLGQDWAKSSFHSGVCSLSSVALCPVISPGIVSTLFSSAWPNDRSSSGVCTNLSIPLIDSYKCLAYNGNETTSVAAQASAPK